MQVDGTKLKLPTYEIKSREGTYGSGVLSLDKLSTELRVGGLRFPLAQLQKLTLEEDGVLTNIDNRLLITLGGVVWTANTVMLEVTQNLTAGQTAAFSIQYGGNFYSMTNLLNQKIVIPHIDGSQLVITAINFITGAIDVETLTPVPGQAYTLSSVSTSTVEGELKNVCIQEEWDLSNQTYANLGPPGGPYTEWFTKNLSVTLYGWEDPETYNSTPGDYAVGVINGRQLRYRASLTLYDHPTVYGENFVKVLLTNRYRLEHSRYELSGDYSFDNSAVPERPDLTVDDEALRFIQPGVPFQVPTNQVLPGNTYTFSLPGGEAATNTGKRYYLDWGASADALVMHLTPGEWYVVDTISGGQFNFRDSANPLPDAAAQWRYSTFYDYEHKYQFRVRGPLAKICVRTEAIDTRRDVHTIVLTVTSIN